MTLRVVRCCHQVSGSASPSGLAPAAALERKERRPRAAALHSSGVASCCRHRRAAGRSFSLFWLQPYCVKQYLTTLDAMSAAFVPGAPALPLHRRGLLATSAPASTDRGRAPSPGQAVVAVAGPRHSTAASTWAAVAAAAGASLLVALPALAAASSMRLPPIDRTVPDAVRCMPKSSAIGQANAARDQLLDLRECDLRNRDLAGFDLSGAILEGARLDGSTFVDAMLSKVYAPKASFRDCDFTNAVVDRALFDGSDMRGSVFANAVLSDTTFEGADVSDTDWTDSYICDFQQRAICKNPSLSGENKDGQPTRGSLGCK
jgi:Pentapeptide repeats (8 copies)